MENVHVHVHAVMIDPASQHKLAVFQFWHRDGWINVKGTDSCITGMNKSEREKKKDIARPSTIPHLFRCSIHFLPLALHILLSVLV